MEQAWSRAGAGGQPVSGSHGVQAWLDRSERGQSSHAAHRDGVAQIPPSLPSDGAFVQLADELKGPQVATVGRMHLHPSQSTSCPPPPTSTIDLRHTDNDASMPNAEPTSFCSRRQLRSCTIATKSLARFDPVEFDDSVVACVEQAALTQGHTVRRMPSGAGHGAQMLARVYPTGMIFAIGERAESQPGRVHQPDRSRGGANVLLEVMPGGCDMGTPLDPGALRGAPMSRHHRDASSSPPGSSARSARRTANRSSTV